MTSMKIVQFSGRPTPLSIHIQYSSTPLFGFSLTSFHLVEASLFPFLWLYTFECAVVGKHHEMSFNYNYSHF